MKYNRHSLAKTPLALAILSAVSFHAAAASSTSLDLTLGATESVKDKIIANTITDKQSWDQSFIKRFGEGSTLTITGTTTDKTLTIGEKGSLVTAVDTNLKHVALNINKGAFTNQAHLTLDKDSSLTINTVAGFDNTKGTITSEGAVTIKDSGLTGVQKDAPGAVAMGSITMSGTNANLVNEDKGYVLKEKEPAIARVSFEQLKLEKGASYTLAKDALDTGKSLMIDKDSKAEIQGTSNWGNVTFEPGRTAQNHAIKLSNDGKLTANLVTLKQVAKDTNGLGQYIEGATDKNLFVNGLALSSFAEQGSFTLKADDLAKAMTLKQGADLTIGRAMDPTQGDKTVDLTLNDYAQGTVTIEGFKAAFESKPAEKPKADKPAANEGTWTYRQFGDVNVHNNGILNLKGNRADGLTKDKYQASVGINKLNFISSDLKVGYQIDFKDVKADVEAALKAQNITVPEGFKDWKDLKSLDAGLKTLASTLDADKRAALKADIEGKLDGRMTVAGLDKIGGLKSDHTIEGSDVAIGALTFGTQKVNVAYDPNKGMTTTADGDTKPEQVEKLDWSTSKNGGAHSLTLKDARVEVGSLTLDAGTLTVSDEKSTLLVRQTGAINGTLNIQNGYVGLNTASTMASRVEAKPVDHATLEINGPVHLGETGRLTLGTGTTSTAADPATQKGAQLTFAGTSTLKFDAAGFGQGALITADGKPGKLTAQNGAKVNLEADNLSWGRYNLFENFESEGVTDKTFTAAEGALKANKVWAEQLAGKKDGIKIETDEKGNVSIVVGSDSVEGSGLRVNARNLVSTIFKGDRNSAPDIAIVNKLLSMGGSLEEVSENINALTGLGAYSGVKALTFDFSGYTADQVEHHAVTMPLKSGGWWAQPLAAQLKSDDLASGESTYGYKIKTVGIMGGYDLALNDMTFGIAGSYQSGDADSTGHANIKTNIDNKALHLWLGKEIGQTRVTGTFSYIRSKGDATLNLAGGEFTSELDATAYALGVRAQRSYPMGGYTFTPHVGARAVMLEMDDYEIALADKALFNVEEERATIFEVPVGVTVQTPTFMCQTFTVQPYADVTLRGRFGDTESSYTLKGSKTTDKIDYAVAGDFVADLKLGYMSTYKNLNLGMSYGLSAGDGGRQNHAIEATIRVDF